VIPEPYSDEVALLAAAAGGELAAVRTVIDRCGPTVYGYLFARVGGNTSTAEDLLQETFIEGLRSSHTFRGDSLLRTWLCAIARRRLARYYESERKAEIVRSGLIAVDSPVEIDPVENRDEVIRALGRLSASHRQVLVMKYLDDLSVEQIARELGRSPVQVQSLLQRARARLRREIEVERA
jgi:RNA polymerase sigma-70 factor, ECF subfamily